jgi:hypothetical protein
MLRNPDPQTGRIKEQIVFSAFRPKPTKVPPARVEVIGYDGFTLEIKSDQTLAVGPLQVVLLHPDLNLEQEAGLEIEQAFPEKQLYWAQFSADCPVPECLKELIPSEVEQVTEEGEPPAPTWEEKRSIARLPYIVGIMSPQVPGFRCLSHDLSSQGIRLQLDKEMPEGPIKVRFELEDHRLDAFDLSGQVQWCQVNPRKGFWAGVRFTNATPTQQAQIDKFIAEVRSHEAGTLTRDYVD